MKKSNLKSVVKKLLVGSTVLCGVALLTPPHALAADNAKPYSMTEVESPTETSVEINGKYYEFSLVPEKIGRHVHVTYILDPGATEATCTAANDCVKVTLPNGKNQYLIYTLDFTPTSSRVTNLSGDITDGVFKALQSTSTTEGGAITNTSTAGYSVTSDFVGNKAEITSASTASAYGGAIYNAGTNAKMGNITGDFVGNYASAASTGGASSVFGVAIANLGTITSVTGDFIGNYASSGGTNGITAYGGAIYNAGTITSLTGNFIGNYINATNSGGTAYGGAIYNGATAGTANIGNITGNFVGNKVNGSGVGYGGAIYNFAKNSGSSAIMGDITGDFIGNYVSSGTKAFGGAISNFASRGATVKIGNITGNFIGNYASSSGTNNNVQGGAIYNHKERNSTPTISSIKGNFIRNYVLETGPAETGAMGGAIFNDGTIGDVTGDFIGNYAVAAHPTEDMRVAGGAIANSGIMTFTGESNFSGNYISDDGGTTTVLNDIMNVDQDGTNAMNLKGTMNLDGGITGVLYEGTVNRGNFNVYGGSTIGFKVRNFNNEGAAFTSANGTIIDQQNVTFASDPDTGATLVTFRPTMAATTYSAMADGETSTYRLFGTTGTIDVGSDVELQAFSDLYDVVLGVDGTGKFDGTFIFGKKESGSVAEKILAAGGNRNDVALGTLLIEHAVLSDNDDFNTVQDTVFSYADAGDYSSVVGATHAMNPDEAPIISESAINNVQNAFGLAGARLTSGVTLADGAKGKAKGKASGAAAKKEGAWVKGFYGKSKLTGGNGFDNKSWGFGIGFDHVFTPNFMAGIAYAYGQSDIDTDTRDIKAKTHTPVIYAEYKKNKWFVDGMVSYSFGKYDEKKSVLGINNDVDYDVNTFGAQVIGGYAVTDWFVPEIGLRYFNVSQKDYTDNLGNNFDRENANVFTGVLGAKFAKAFKPNYNFKLIPEVRLAVSYDFVRDNNSVDVTLANMHSYTFKGEKLDRFGFEVDGGFKVDAGQFELSARYQGRFRNHYTNHTGLLEARYEF